jgi:hypothetical protein
MPDPVVPVTASLWGMEYSIHGERSTPPPRNTRTHFIFFLVFDNHVEARLFASLILVISLVPH